jgi:putative Mg2+ transporter-C (MgtC) family protein
MQPLGDPSTLQPDVGDALLRLVVATLVGAAIGLDRELRGKPAGMRTHGLVALGSALVTLVSVHFAFAGFITDGNAVTRTIQGIIAGVGFLGGGVILKTSERGTVQGLTTAATIWLVACLGITAGTGLWALTAAASLVSLVLLVFGGPFERWVRLLARRRRDRDDSQRRRRAERRLRADRRAAAAEEQRRENEGPSGMPPGVG